jgi:hypothetical protein
MTFGGGGLAIARARQDRGLNWNLGEVSVLVLAKRDLYLVELDVVDRRELIVPETTK